MDAEQSPEASTEFDYERIDIDVFNVRPDSDLSELSIDEMEKAIVALRSVIQWIYQSGSRNPDGVKIRAILASWIFLKELRSLTLTQMARGYGLKKQSLGRWHGDFKRSFPTIKTPHMR